MLTTSRVIMAFAVVACVFAIAACTATLVESWRLHRSVQQAESEGRR